MWLYGYKLIKKSDEPTKIGGDRHFVCEKLDFVCHVILKKPRDQRIKKSYGWKLPRVSHHPAKFGGHMYCGVGHNGFSLPGVSQDCVIKGHVTLWAGDTQCNSQSTRFGDNGHCESGNIMVLVCHVILEGHVIKESYKKSIRRSVQKQWQEGKREKRKAISKLPRFTQTQNGPTATMTLSLYYGFFCCFCYFPFITVFGKSVFRTLAYI